MSWSPRENSHVIIFETLQTLRGPPPERALRVSRIITCTFSRSDRDGRSCPRAPAARAPLSGEGLVGGGVPAAGKCARYNFRNSADLEGAFPRAGPASFVNYNVRVFAQRP